MYIKEEKTVDVQGKYLIHLLQTKWWILPTHHNERVQYYTQRLQCCEQYI